MMIGEPDAEYNGLYWQELVITARYLLIIL